MSVIEKFPWKHPHFIGVGGVGMAGLAHILADFGISVSGSDAAESKMLDSLRERGLPVCAGHLDAVPPEADLVVYSNAVPPENPERQDARRRGIRSCLRGAFLAELAECFPTVVSVSGSHGKTTTTAMLVHILCEAGLNPGFMVGALLPGRCSASAGGGRILVTEVDESDGTQALMRSSHGLILNVEDDHCWSLGGLAELEGCFSTFAAGCRHLLAWGSPTTRRLFSSHPDVEFLGGRDLPEAHLVPLPGEHNRQNASLALRAAELLGVERNLAIRCLSSFPGVDRRLSLRFAAADGSFVVIEDYAHHPTELEATLSALRERYPDSHLTVLFQPHRFERVRRFGTAFAEILGTVDSAFVLPPFAAWRQDQDLADPAEIARQVPCPYHLGSREELVETVLAQKVPGRRVVAVVGAGDIGKLVPLLVESLAASGI